MTVIRFNKKVIIINLTTIFLFAIAIVAGA